MGLTVPCTGTRDEGEKYIFFHQDLLMTLAIFILIDMEFNGKR